MSNRQLEYTSAGRPIGGHLIKIEAPHVEYYGQGGLAESRKCVQCGWGWSYLASDEEITGIPCLADPVAAGTLREIRSLKSRIADLYRQIKWVQQHCPHKYTQEEIEETTSAPTFQAVFNVCVVCGDVVSAKL